MKTIKYIFITTFAALLSVSCGKFLDPPYPSHIVDGNMFQNDEEVYAAVVGCYNQLQAVSTGEWAVTELRSDNTRAYGANSTATTSKELVQMDQNASLSSTNFVNDYWEASYDLVYRSNNVLANLDVMRDEDLKNRFEGEMRFLRAHAYFNIVRLWGPSFVMDTPIKMAEARYKQRASVEQTYEFILEDLNYIVDNELLPTREAMASADLGRVTMEAAKATLAKVFLTAFPIGSDEYLRGGTLLREVITACGDPASAADLVPFDAIFDVGNEMNAEIIFAVRYKAGNHGLGSQFGNMFAPILSGSNVIIGQGRSFNYVTTNVIDAFEVEPADLRIGVSYAKSYVNQVTGVEVTEETSRGAARFIKKFLDPAQTVVEDGENDFPIIRLGDVILLYAEVCNEIGQSAEALKYLNIVRGRAGLEPATATNLFDLRTMIRNERRKELAFENHRFFDLVRWGIALDTLNDYVRNEGFYDGAANYPYTPIQNWNLLLPIPQKVMNINSQLSQNPGY